MSGKNRGEWSEIYVLFRLLADGRLYAADEDLKRLENVFFPIINIIREERKNHRTEYRTGDMIRIYVDEEEKISLPASKFEEQAKLLLGRINEQGNGNRSFSVPQTEQFMRVIFCERVSAKSTDKKDIVVTIHDVHTGYTPTVGFSIKSQLGSPSTLLNSSQSTNFRYRIIYDATCCIEDGDERSSYGSDERKAVIQARMRDVISKGGKFEFERIKKQAFEDNLMLIDSRMDLILAETLLYYYRDGIVKCADMVAELENENPLGFRNINAYQYKFKKLLSAAALGMTPASSWNGRDEATGGYIVVTKEGDVVAYHIYNRDAFEEYLLRNTKYDTPDTKRNKYGSIYTEDGDEFIDLNLQIRFKK